MYVARKHRTHLRWPAIMAGALLITLTVFMAGQIKADAPVIVQITMQGTNVVDISANVTENGDYVLRRTQNLTSGPWWVDIATQTVTSVIYTGSGPIDSGAIVVITQTDPDANGAIHFYRVVHTKVGSGTTILP